MEQGVTFSYPVSGRLSTTDPLFDSEKADTKTGAFRIVFSRPGVSGPEVYSFELWTDTVTSNVTQEELDERIKRYEEQFGMTSEEFLEKWNKGEAPDTFETMLWSTLLDYR